MWDAFDEKTSDSRMSVKEKLRKLADPARAKVSQSFFKTGKGEYGEGDVFWGIKVPDIRVIAKESKDVSLEEINSLLHDKVHECRMCALLILIEKYKRASVEEKEAIVKFYLENKSRVNNWDLVDGSAPYILGDYLLSHDRAILYIFSGFEDVWTRRIAIVATQTFIRNNEFEDTLKLSELLMQEKHDLMHKACGWMLREVGKRDERVLVRFLEKHAKRMPRTMLRYAIERLDKVQRARFMKP